MTAAEYLREKWAQITYRNWTVLIIVGTTVGLLAWDIWAAAHEHGSTISTVLLDGAQRHPVIPFLFGVWMGHLFWFQERKQ